MKRLYIVLIMFDSCTRGVQRTLILKFFFYTCVFTNVYKIASLLCIIKVIDDFLNKCSTVCYTHNNIIVMDLSNISVNIMLLCT